METIDRLSYCLASSYMALVLLNSALENYISSAGVVLVVWEGLGGVVFLAYAVRAWRIK